MHKDGFFAIWMMIMFVIDRFIGYFLINQPMIFFYKT